MHSIRRMLVLFGLYSLIDILIDLIGEMFQGKVNEYTAVFFPHIDQVVDVQPLLGFHPHHCYMEEAEIHEDLGPHTSSFSEAINDSHIDLVTKEASSSVSCNACFDHVHEMILDNVVFELHVKVEMVVCFCCWILDLFIEMTPVEAHQHGHLTQAEW